MNRDRTEDGGSALEGRTPTKRRNTAGQKPPHTDHERYENFLRRMEEVYTEVANLRREHSRLVSWLMGTVAPLLEARQGKTALSKREYQVREMRRAGRLEKQIAAELGLGINSVKSYEYRARKKEQLQREREEQARKRRL